MTQPPAPDSRVLRRQVGFGGVTMPRYWLDGRHQRVYCANCGAESGWASIPDEGLTGIVYVCDPCATRMPGLIVAPIPEPTPL